MQAYASVAGKDFVIGVRINGREFGHPNAMTPEEAAESARLLEAAGADYISVTGYGYGSPEPMQYVADYWPYPEPDEFMKPYLRRFKTGLLVPEAEAVKQAVQVPVITVGRLDEELGEEILRRAQSRPRPARRPLWRDLRHAQQAGRGREDDIVRCCRCGTCEDPQDAPRRCRVNPTMGREKELAIVPATTTKDVLVVGGGPAGMEAARVAALRGHRVTLCEKSPYLGGKLHLAAMVKGTQFDDVTTIILYGTGSARQATGDGQTRARGRRSPDRRHPPRRGDPASAAPTHCRNISPASTAPKWSPSRRWPGWPRSPQGLLAPRH